MSSAGVERVDTSLQLVGPFGGVLDYRHYLWYLRSAPHQNRPFLPRLALHMSKFS